MLDDLQSGQMLGTSGCITEDILDVNNIEY